mgnify:CR=1 FL=1
MLKAPGNTSMLHLRCVLRTCACACVCACVHVFVCVCVACVRVCVCTCPIYSRMLLKALRDRSKPELAVDRCQLTEADVVADPDTHAHWRTTVLREINDGRSVTRRE